MEINHEILSFNIDSAYFSVKVDEEMVTRYLKGVYRSNKPRFKENFTKFFRRQFKAREIEEFNYILDNIEFIWDFVEPFSYKEAFELTDARFKSIVFSSIDIRQMIDNLGAKRVKVEGIDLINKTWNPIKECFEDTPYTAIYELHYVSGEKLGIADDVLPVIKCWCTTTNEEHWMWVDSSFIENDSPLHAVASTCVIYKSMHGKINHIIRQGDVFLFEMSEDVMPSETEETMSLPMSEYFSLLKSQA